MNAKSSYTTHQTPFSLLLICRQAEGCRPCQTYIQLLCEHILLSCRHAYLLRQYRTRHSISEFPSTMAGGGLSGGTGQKLTQATVIIAGGPSLVASLLSILYVILDRQETCWLTSLEQVGLASNVCRYQGIGVENLLINDSKNYRKPLLQRYVVRILLM